jgi:hypothetical protein
VGQYEVASFARRFLQHPMFATHTCTRCGQPITSEVFLWRRDRGTR